MTTTLLCLHGMDATGRVWDGVAAAWTHGPVLAPDLAGHGGARRLERYHLADHADDVLDRLGDSWGDRVVILGHSMGGAVALAVAGRRPSGLVGVVGVGVKTSWSDDELTGLHRVADKGVARFDDELAARQRFLRVSGLDGLAEPTSDLAASGVAPDQDGAWRLAVDPLVHRLDRIDFDALVAAADAPVLLARGGADTMVPPGDTDRFGVRTAEVAGAGHNAHVEDPGGVVALVERLL